MKAPLQTRAEPFDFRSQHFCDSAQWLVEMTGRSLQLCRQELFLAEGDVAEARAALCAADAARSDPPSIH